VFWWRERAAGRAGDSFCRRPPATDAPKGEGGGALDGPGGEEHEAAAGKKKGRGQKGARASRFFFAEMVPPVILLVGNYPTTSREGMKIEFLEHPLRSSPIPKIHGASP
jgi:hypothetical protein